MLCASLLTSLQHLNEGIFSTAMGRLHHCEHIYITKHHLTSCLLSSLPYSLILILIFFPICWPTRYSSQGLISYGEFRRVFQASEEDMESRGGDASNIEFIPPKQITEIAEQYSVSASSYLCLLFFGCMCILRSIFSSSSMLQSSILSLLSFIISSSSLITIIYQHLLAYSFSS